MLSSNSKSKSKSKSKSPKPKSSKSKSIKSIKSCYTYNEYVNQLNALGKILLQQYNNGIEATLNKENEQLLHYVSSRLKHMTHINGIEFNEKKFVSFVKKVLTVLKQHHQKGGVRNKNDDGQLVPYNGDSHNDEVVPYENDKQSKIDIASIIGLIFSFVLLFIAYHRFNDITKKTIGTDLMTHKDITQVRLQTLPREQYTFLKFVSTYFTDLGCVFVDKTSEDIINFVTVLLKDSMKDYMKLASESCRKNYNIVDEKTPGAFIINPVTNLITSFVTKDSTVECMKEVARIQREKWISEFNYNINVYTNTVFTEVQQIKDLLLYASSLGSSAVVALFSNILYRLNRRRLRMRSIRRGGKKQTIKHKKFRKYKTKRV